MKRLENIRKTLAEKDIDALIVLNELNQHYLSGFAFTDGLLLICAESAYLITDFRYYEMAENEAFSEFEVLMPEKRVETVTELLKKHGCKTVGFEGNSVSFATYHKYCETYPFCNFVSIGNAIEEQREIKDEGEIELMQKAQDITDAAFSHVLSHIRTDMTETFI